MPSKALPLKYHGALGSSARVLRSGGGVPRLLVIWALLTATLALTADNFLTISNFVNIFKEMAISGTVAVGLAVAIIAGAVDLAFPTIMSLSAIALVGIAERGIPPLLCVLVVTLIGAGIGGFNGLLSGALRIDALLVTLGASTALSGVLFLITDGQTYLLNGSFYQRLGRGDYFGMPAPILVMLLVGVVCTCYMRFTAHGQELAPTGDNAKAAELLGLGVVRLRVIALAISGATAAIAGTLLASGGGAASTGYADVYLLPVLAGVVLGGIRLSGGKGTVLAALVGTAILGTLSNGMNLLAINPFTQMIVQGGVILAALSIYALGEST